MKVRNIIGLLSVIVVMGAQGSSRSPAVPLQQPEWTVLLYMGAKAPMECSGVHRYVTESSVHNCFSLVASVWDYVLRSSVPSPLNTLFSPMPQSYVSVLPSVVVQVAALYPARRYVVIAGEYEAGLVDVHNDALRAALTTVSGDIGDTVLIDGRVGVVNAPQVCPGLSDQLVDVLWHMFHSFMRSLVYVASSRPSLWQSLAALRTQLIGARVGSVDMYAWLTSVKEVLQGEQGDEVIIGDIEAQIARLQALYRAVLVVSGNDSVSADQMMLCYQSVEAPWHSFVLRSELDYL